MATLLLLPALVLTAQSFTIDQVMSGPFASELITQGNSAAWLQYEKGRRNIYSLRAGKPVQLTPEFKMPVARLALAINAFLPHDIRVLSARRVPEAFHARFDATGKQYRYFIWNHPAMNPLLQNRAWHFPIKLDLAKMRAAAKLFIGRHDFRSLAGTRSYEMASTVRSLNRCDIRKSGPQLTFIIEGDGFLYKMCRGIVGTVVQVGQGKIPLARVAEILASRDRRAAGMTAPAHGLVLWKVFYSTQSRKDAELKRPQQRLD